MSFKRIAIVGAVAVSAVALVGGGTPRPEGVMIGRRSSLRHTTIQDLTHTPLLRVRAVSLVA